MLRSIFKTCFSDEKPNMGISYEEIKKNIKPFDLICFKSGYFISNVIKYSQLIANGNADFTHVGIIVTTDVLPNIRNGKPGELYVWESNYDDNVMDVEEESNVFGVQITRLQDVIKAYKKDDKGVVAIAHLKNNPIIRTEKDTDESYEQRMSDIIDKMEKLHVRYHHRIYNFNILDLLSSVFPCFRCCRCCFCSSKQYIFCSDLVARVYQELGLIPIEFDSKNIVPVDLIGHDNDEVIINGEKVEGICVKFLDLPVRYINC